MDNSQSHSEDEIYGSRPYRRFERWEQERTMCISELCIYAYTCPFEGVRQRYVPKRECYRHRPEAERPPVELSAKAVKFLKSYRSKKK